MNSEDTKDRRTLDVSSENDDDDDDIEEDFFASLPLNVSSLLRLRPFDFLPITAVTSEEDEEDIKDLVEGCDVDETTVFERSIIEDKEEGNEDEGDDDDDEDERSDSQLLKRGRESHSFANEADSDSVVADSIVVVASGFAESLKKVNEIEREDHEATEPAIFRIEFRTKSRFLSAFVSTTYSALTSK